MKNVLKPLAKSVLTPLGLIATASDAPIHRKMFGYGMRSSDLAKRTKLIISSEEMNDIMKTVKSLEESGLLTKRLSETIKNESEEQKGGFLSILLGTLSASLLGNLLKGKGTIRASEDTIRAGQGL